MQSTPVRCRDPKGRVGEKKGEKERKKGENGGGLGRRSWWSKQELELVLKGTARSRGLLCDGRPRTTDSELEFESEGPVGERPGDGDDESWLGTGAWSVVEGRKLQRGHKLYTDNTRACSRSMRYTRLAQFPTPAVSRRYYIQNRRPLARSYQMGYHAWLLACSDATASASFFWNSFSASTHTRAVLRSGNCMSDGRRSELNCSDASLGSNVGRWSIEITDSGGFPALRWEKEARRLAWGRCSSG